MKTLESHKELKEISADPAALKEALSAKDGAQIVSLMEKFGKATTEAGQNVETGGTIFVGGTVQLKPKQ